MGTSTFSEVAKHSNLGEKKEMTDNKRVNWIEITHATIFSFRKYSDIFHVNSIYMYIVGAWLLRRLCLLFDDSIFIRNNFLPFRKFYLDLKLDLKLLHWMYLETLDYMAASRQQKGDVI